MSKLITVKNISKSFDSFLAVKDISFSLSKGDILGFLGPNGAGKTTTMRVLTGFLKPDSGKVLINNIDIFTNLEKARQCIGYVPEGSPLYNEMTTLDFLSFICEIRQISVKEKLPNVIELLDLENVLFQKIETLSKGFKRRVGLAQALIHNPEILILDEPTDGLDPNQKNEVRKLIKKLAKEKAIIISTHILEEVKAICNRTMVISEGKLLIDDSPNNILRKSSSYNNISLSVEEKSSTELKTEFESLNKFTNILVKNNKCNIKLNNLSERTYISKHLKKKGYTINHFSLDRGNLEEVFYKLTNRS